MTIEEKREALFNYLDAAGAEQSLVELKTMSDEQINKLYNEIYEGEE